MNQRSAVLLLVGLLALPAMAATAAKTAAAPKTPSKQKAAPSKPAPPDDLTAPGVRHVAVCPPPKIAPCVMRKPLSSGYRVLTNGVDVADDGINWLVDFGKGPKESPFLLQVLDSGGSLHDIEVTFRSKPGMRKTPTLPEE
jgi:hypothetical protein